MRHGNEQALRSFVRRLMARSSLRIEEQEAILAWPGQAAPIRARHDFVHINDESTSSCLVVSGIVARFGQLRDGARQTTAFHIAGDMADLHSTVRPIGIGGLHAICDTVIMRVPHRAIRESAARYPAIGEALWRDCILDAAILMQWVVNVGQRNAVTRIAHFFCEMAVRYGHGGKKIAEFPFPVTQQQLGEATALTAIHVNRTLKQLREAGQVSLRAGVLRIDDWDRLVRLGEFDAAYLIGDTGLDRQPRLLARYDHGDTPVEPPTQLGATAG